MAEVTVVVGNHDGAAVLGDCLESLSSQTAAPAEVVVVDAESTDASASIAAAHGARWLAASNRGLGHLYNRGIATASTPYVLVTNNDVALDPHCLELLRDALEGDDTIFAADPRQMSWDGARLVHGHTTLRRGRMLHELLPGLRLDQLGAAPRPTPTVMANAGCMLVRRSMALELGGFDETFFLDFEDLDLCWRAWLRGWGSVHVPDATLRHRVGAAMTASILPRRLQSSHHNLLRFALKCLPARNAAVVIAAELVRVPRHGRPVARALGSVCRELPEILAARRTARPSRDLLERLVAAPGHEARPVRGDAG